MKRKAKRIIYLIIVIVICSIIFYFSNQKANTSSTQSSRVVNIIINFFSLINKNMNEAEKLSIEGAITLIIRKIAHLSLYTVLGICTFNYLSCEDKIKTKYKKLYCILFCFLYAISDEFHQFFIEGRSGEIRDIIIDTIGAGIGILLVIFVKKIAKNIRKEEKCYNGGKS